MYTVCPKCALTLVVTPADLRIAQGYVRCGRCLNVFNALVRLSEERPLSAPPPAPSLPEEPAPLPRFAPPPEPEPAAARGENTAVPAAAPSSEPAEPAPLPAGDDIEVQIDACVLAGAAAAAEPMPPEEPLAADSQSPTPLPGAEGEEEGPAAAAAPISDDASPPSTVEGEPEHIVVLETAAAAGPPPEPGVDSGVTCEPAAEAAAEPPLEPTPEPEPGPAPAPEAIPASELLALARKSPRAPIGWTLGAAVLVLVLALQAVNHYRDRLATYPPPLGPLTTVYARLGIPLVPRWNVHAYDVLQLGATMQGSAPREIIVRASVRNAGSDPLPMPLLRVILQDPFGNAIAARDVPPRAYLPGATRPSALIPGGGRIEATVALVDPGPRATGFEIDACLARAGGAVACAHTP